MRSAEILFAAVLGSSAWPTPVVGASYPTRPIRVIAHVTPGTSPDVVVRIIAERLSPNLGQPVVVENRPGASGTIGLAAVARAQPDGYTFGTMTFSHAVAPALLSKLPYDTLKQIAPIRQTTQASLLMVVRAEAPWRSIGDLVAAAKAQPGRLSCGSAGSGTPPHLGLEVFKLATGVDLLHVPFKGGPPAANALLAQQVDVLSTSAVTVAGFLRQGRLRALATTGPVRMAVFPDVPTMAESGYPGFDVRDWQGLVAPAGTPRAVIERIASEVNAILATESVRARLADLGLEPVATSNPEAFGAHIAAELKRWDKIVRAAGVKLD